MKAVVFPGQGSQSKGMGADLFDTVSQFAELESQIDALLGYSLRSLCLSDDGAQLNQTQYTQPCLYVVNALHFYQARSQGLNPNYYAGHSLGEYNALLAAGAFDLVTGLKLVQKRGELMAQAKEGGMAAVIGLAPEAIAQRLAEQQLQQVEIANFNSPAQTVISGLKQDVERAGTALEEAGAKLFIPLAVSGAFHSSLMRQAAEEYQTFLKTFEFHELLSPVISNVTAAPYPLGNANQHIPELLVKQMFSPVQWTHSIQYLLEHDVDTFDEIGPGKVLSKLTQQIRQNHTVAA